MRQLNIKVDPMVVVISHTGNTNIIIPKAVQTAWLTMQSPHLVQWEHCADAEVIHHTSIIPHNYETHLAYSS